MARILLGWELGAGTGHIVKLTAIASALAGQGHEPIIAASDPITLDGRAWQAPLWPAQMASRARHAIAAPSTMGDILAIAGLGEPGAASAMIGGWDRLLQAIRPDAIGAEYAPGLMLAAFGRVPLLALGTGFSLPPSQLPNFASLNGRPPIIAEDALRDRVDAALAAHGRPPLPFLPAIFRADRTLVASFRELDPYRAWRTEPQGAPSAMIADPAGPGNELFVYLNGTFERPPAFWDGLIASGLPVRIHDPVLSAAQQADLARRGLIVEPAAVPFAQIAARSRIVLSHGSHGFTSSALIAGLPHILLPFDTEKQMTAVSVTELGLGVLLGWGRLEAASFAATLRASWDDDEMARAARAKAPDFRARAASDAHGEAAGLLIALARG